MSSQELFLTHLDKLQTLIFSRLFGLFTKIIPAINFSQLTGHGSTNTLFKGISFRSNLKRGKDSFLLSVHGRTLNKLLKIRILKYIT